MEELLCSDLSPKYIPSLQCHMASVSAGLAPALECLPGSGGLRLGQEVAVSSPSAAGVGERYSWDLQCHVIPGPPLTVFKTDLLLYTAACCLVPSVCLQTIFLLPVPVLHVYVMLGSQTLGANRMIVHWDAYLFPSFPSLAMW